MGMGRRFSYRCFLDSDTNAREEKENPGDSILISGVRLGLWQSQDSLSCADFHPCWGEGRGGQQGV